MSILPDNPVAAVIASFLAGIGIGIGSEIGKWFFKHYTKPHLELTRTVISNGIKPPRKKRKK